MKRVRFWQATVVTALALIAALAGTAIAGPVATTSKDRFTKSEKKKVKKLAKRIADKRIAKAAPGLSVASAANATNADRATSAGSVDGVTHFSFNENIGAERVIFSGNGLTLTAKCGSNGDLKATTAANNAVINNYAVITGTGSAGEVKNIVADNDFDTNENKQLLNDFTVDVLSQTSYVAANGDAVQLIWGSEDEIAGFTCSITGTAFEN